MQQAIKKCDTVIDKRIDKYITYLFTYLLTYLLHGAESFLRS